jgi:hypothetical protein
MGDDPRYPYPDSFVAFAHLGTEVKMRRNDTQSIVENNYAHDRVELQTMGTGGRRRCQWQRKKSTGRTDS